MEYRLSKQICVITCQRKSTVQRTLRTRTLANYNLQYSLGGRKGKTFAKNAASKFEVIFHSLEKEA